MKALGMIEVYSFTTAVCVADICAKTSDVKVIAFDRNRPKSADVPAPLVMEVKISGSVDAVQAAIEADGEITSGKITIYVSPSEISKMTGQKRSNIESFLQMGISAQVKPDADLGKYMLRIEE